MVVQEVRLADFGEGIHEAEILEWLVAVGDHVKRDQPLVEVHTEKVNDEIVSPFDGTVISLEHGEGDTVKVGDLLIQIETDQSTATEPAQAKEKNKTATPEDKGEKDDSLFVPITQFKRGGQKNIVSQSKAREIVNERVLASPAVRRRAREARIDLQFVRGTGQAGRIHQSDVDNHEGEKRVPKQPGQKTVLVPQGETRIPLKGTRKTIASAMRRSKDSAAHYSYFEEVDMTALNDLRSQLKPIMEEKGIKVTYVALVMKCLVPALRNFPLLNSSLDENSNEIVLHHSFNLGISVDTEDGLIVPVVKNVEQKSIWEVAEEIIDLANRARSGKLKLKDIQGGTFTITSVGNIGGVMATPIINHPESAILGLMKSKLRPVVIEKYGKPEIAIRPMMYLSLSLDHRIVDGAVGARFINELIKYMEHPALVWLEEEH